MRITTDNRKAKDATLLVIFLNRIVIRTQTNIKYIMKTLIKHTFFTDGSHGWLKVSKNRLAKLNILNKITECSFVKGNNLYLEEDCDFSTYIDALLLKEGIKDNTEEYKAFMKKFWELTTIKDTSNNDRGSIIRTYNNYVILNEEETKEKNDLLKLILNHKRWDAKGVRTIKNGTLEDLRYWKDFYKL
jgi:hypothetical protein